MMIDNTPAKYICRTLSRGRFSTAALRRKMASKNSTTAPSWPKKFRVLRPKRVNTFMSLLWFPNRALQAQILLQSGGRRITEGHRPIGLAMDKLVDPRRIELAHFCRAA